MADSTPLYALVFEQSPLPMWVVDGATLTLLAVNDAARRESGYARGELLGMAVTTLCPSEDLAMILAETPKMHGQVRARLGRLRHRDGGFLEVHQTWVPLCTEGKAAWLVMLTAPLRRYGPGAVRQTPSHSFTCSLPELTADLFSTHHVLRAALAESRAAAVQLRSTLYARDVEMRTLQHRIKSTLQLAISLFNLQRSQHLEPRLAAPFAVSAQRLKVLALLHEALEQASPAPSIDGATYLQAIRAAVIRAYQVDRQRILLRTHADRIVLPPVQAMPCGMILNELLTNAVTHAFPEGRSGTVTIEIQRLPTGSVMLRVTDTGRGVPEEIDIHQPRRFGWQLVRLLTKQLHGSLDLTRARGTCITVRFPC
jgi:PAS domain S-box-containing protein